MEETHVYAHRSSLRALGLLCRGLRGLNFKNFSRRQGSLHARNVSAETHVLSKQTYPLTRWKVSHYTHCIKIKDRAGIFYNGYSGAIIELSLNAYQKAYHILKQLSTSDYLSKKIEEDRLFSHLVAGGFIVDAQVDEIALIENQYESERRKSKFLLTILPTFTCNLNCAYCFVSKKQGTMTPAIQEQIVHFIANHLRTHSIPSMNVDWLGGEPLLALPTIQFISRELQKLSDSLGIPYSAQVITNGTLLTKKSIRLLQRAGVDRLQVTIDGPREIHDQRRGFKSDNESSFAAILSGLEQAIGKFVIRLRINIDSYNINEVLPLLDLFKQRGWLGPDTMFFPYLARLSPFTEACANVANHSCGISEFQKINFKWWNHLEQLGVQVAFQPLYEFPEPRLYNCGAVSPNSYIFTPEGEIHKCGLTIDDSTQAIGRIDETLEVDLSNSRQWLEYSPFRNPVCRACKFIPTCLGGCPRNQIQKRKMQISENCIYYRRFELEILRFHMKLTKIHKSLT